MTESVAQDMIVSFFDRWQRLEEEKTSISADLREMFAEAKGLGFEAKVLRRVFRDAVADSAERAEFEAVYDLYAAALGTIYANARDTREENAATGNPSSGSGAATASLETPKVATHSDPVSAGAAESLLVPLISDEAQSSPAGAEGDADRQPTSNVTQLYPEKRITFNDKPHVDCLDPGQCGGFSNLGLCPRCKAVAAGGAAEIEHHGSIGR